jgi:hypothetical protein
MKKIIRILALVMVVSALLVSGVMAIDYSLPYQAYKSDIDYVGASTGVTVDISANSYGRVVIDSITFESDLTTSMVSIYVGATTGTTDNYTLIGKLSGGDGTVQYTGSAGQPFFIGDANYQYRILGDCTTAGTVIVKYGYAAAN